MIVAIMLAISCLACLLYFIHHMASSIQASQVVDRIARETERVLDELFPRPLTYPPIEEFAKPSPAGAPVLAHRSGYIRFVDESSLLAAAIAGAATTSQPLYRAVRDGGHIRSSRSSPAERTTDALRAACLAPSTSAPPERCSETSSLASCRSSTSP